MTWSAGLHDGTALDVDDAERVLGQHSGEQFLRTFSGCEFVLFRSDRDGVEEPKTSIWCVDFTEQWIDREDEGLELGRLQRCNWASPANVVLVVERCLGVEDVAGQLLQERQRP